VVFLGYGKWEWGSGQVIGFAEIGLGLGMGKAHGVRKEYHGYQIRYDAFASQEFNLI
jgi:hypothetical protein